MARPTDNLGRKPWTKNREAVYLSLPPMPPPELTSPVTFCIPDDPDWRAALYGAISLMGSWLAWKRDDARTGREVAAVWNEIILKAQRAAEGGEESECMDYCQIIADCISDNGAAAQAIRDFLANDQGAIDAITNIYNQQAGGVIPAGQLGTNFGNVTDCDPDLLYNVCNSAVDLLNTVSTDIFEALELATNAAERSSRLISAIPALGAIVPFDEILDLADDIVSSFLEAYNAAYTVELAEDIKCGIFCISKPDCELNVDDLISYYEDQFNHSLPQGILEAIVDLVEFLVNGSFSGETIVYGMHLLCLSSLRTVTGTAGQTFATFATRLLAAGDEANNDWELLCEDCPPDDPCNGGENLTTSANGWTSATGSADYTVYHANEGFGRGNTTPNRIGIRKSMPITIGQTITVTWLLPTTGQLDLTTFNYSGRLSTEIVGIANTVWSHVSTANIPSGVLIDMYPSFAGSNFPPEQRVICIKVT